MKVCILLSTYNGQEFLEEQIESLLNLRGVEFSIFVRDDGSTDNTVSILQEYSNRNKLIYFIGENLKPAHSFLELIKKSPDADFYALCDQDDYWESQKLEKAIDKLKNYPMNLPALYFSKAEMYDKNLQHISGGTYPDKAYTLGTALLRNNATGCTMVFNKSLRNFLNMYTPPIVLMHDHWIYLLCLALNGTVVFDNKCYIKYRQHQNNVIGARHTPKVILLRSGMFDKSRIRSTVATEIYNNYKDYIPIENIKLLLKIINYRDSIRYKMMLILSRDISSHSVISNISLLFCIVSNRL